MLGHYVSRSINVLGRAEIALMPSIQARNYGIRRGSTTAIATAIGFALGIEHIGWIVGAGLFVMWPSQDIQEFRQQMAYSISVYWCNRNLHLGY